YRARRPRMSVLAESSADAALERGEGLPRLAVGLHEAGVEARALLLAEPLVVVDPRDLRAHPVAVLVVELRLREHQLDRAGGARQVAREVRLELDDAAGLGQPHLAGRDPQDGLQAARAVVVDVLVVVQAPDAALAARE